MLHWALLGVLLATQACASQPASVPAPESPQLAGGRPLATWAGDQRLTAAAYADWLAWRNLTDSDDAVREFALVLALADAARERGADRDAGVQLKVQMARQRILGAALRQHVVAQTKVGNDEVARHLEENPAAFEKPRKYRLYHLYKALPAAPEAADDVRARMSALREQVLAGADFSRLAREESESASRFRDGYAGRLAADELPEPFANAVRALKPGGVSDVVEHAGGLTLFYCDGIEEAVEREADEQRRLVRAALIRHHSKLRWAQVQREVLDAVPPVTNEELERVASLKHDGKSLADLGEAQRQALREQWVLGIALARRAEALGLADEPAIARSLRWLTTQTLAEQELTRRVDARLRKPTEADVRAHFEAHQRRYRMPTSYRLAGIFLGPPGPETVDLAREITQAVDRGELAFAAAARAHSQDPSASAGGLIGWFPAPRLGDLGVNVSQAIRRLPVGGHTGPMNTPSGLWIYRLEDRKPARSLTQEEAAPEIHKALRRRDIEALTLEVRRDTLTALDVRIVRPAAADAAVRGKAEGG